METFQIKNLKGLASGKSGLYKDIYCHSSWELAYVVYCLDHNIKIERNLEERVYQYNGKFKIYVPDFVVEGCLVEIKGYCSKQWLAKIATNPDVKVLYEKDLAFVFNYMKGKYGKDWIRLYE